MDGWDCPDCTGVMNLKKMLRHDSTCPTGRGIDEMSEADREWFEAHPGETEYVRPLHWTERDQLIRSGDLNVPRPVPGASLEGETLVMQARPGVRIRRFRSLWWALPSAPQTGSGPSS